VLPLLRPHYYGRLVVMPKKSVIECVCDRCGRVWYEDWSPSGEEKKPGGSFRLELTMPDATSTTVAYDVLCATCSKAVVNYVAHITRELKTVSKAKKKAPEAPTSTPKRSK
jgi:hypothetical protein